MKGRSPLMNRNNYPGKASSLERRNKSENKPEELVHWLPKAEPLKAFVIPELSDFIVQFHKQIQSPIDFHTSIHLTKTAQRCLAHNNVSTLYCLNDRLPLCVTCMYQSNLHKKHKVVPLNRSSVELTEELKMHVKGIRRSLAQVSELAKRSHQNLDRAEREFPEMIDKVNRFYQGLHELLVQKKTEQVKHIQQTWSRVKYEYSAYAREFEKINVYAIERVREIEERTSEEQLLFNRNVAVHLAKLQRIIGEEMGKYHETKYAEELSRFIDVEKLINAKMVFTNPLVETVKREGNRARQRKNQSSYDVGQTVPVAEPEIKAHKTEVAEIVENRKRSVSGKDEVKSKSSKALKSLHTSLLNAKEGPQKISPLKANSRSAIKPKLEIAIMNPPRRTSQKRQ